MGQISVTISTAAGSVLSDIQHDGDEFLKIGQEYSYQNPVYSVRTFPEKLRVPSGEPAYSSWTGGLLGVVGAQMDDVNEMARAWYISDLLGG